MVSTRFLGLVSTVLLVVGALAVGEALHRTVVTGEAPLTALPMLVYYGVGTAFILLGYRIRQPVGERYALGSDDDREPAERAGREPGGAERSEGGGPPGSPGERPDGEEFDPAMSPLGDAAPGDARAHDDDATADGRDDRDGAG